MTRVMKKVFIVYFRLLKKLPATVAVSTIFMIMSFVYMNFYVLIFLLLFIPGLLMIDLLIKLPFIAHDDAKHTAELYGNYDISFKKALKELLK